MTLPTLSVVRKTKEATNSTKGGDFFLSLYVVHWLKVSSNATTHYRVACSITFVISCRLGASMRCVLQRPHTPACLI